MNKRWWVFLVGSTGALILTIAGLTVANTLLTLSGLFIGVVLFVIRGYFKHSD